MLIYPAIDLYEGKVVRLFKGEYNQMTVYNDDPLAIAEDFRNQGSSCIHVVDLEGAKSGTTPNIDTIKSIKTLSSLFVEVGGGIRNMAAAAAYVDAGVDRIILGTAAVENEDFVKKALAAFGDKVAVGIDLRDGYVAVKGWTEKTGLKAMDFAKRMEELGVATIICTDISRDGAMKGTNRQLYRELAGALQMNIIASGGVSTMEDIRELAAMDLHGAIIGKAYYEGAISIREAVEVAQ